jgi:hypothetical protein
MLGFDFGVECAGWLELTSSDLAAALVGNGGATVTMSTSEHTQPQYTTPTRGNNNGNCTKGLVPIAPGVFQLVLNSELYEGLRYGWLHVQADAGTTLKFTVTNIAAVCQVLPLNYFDHSFVPGGAPAPPPTTLVDDALTLLPGGSGAAALAEVWYTAMYTTRVDLLPAPALFGSILMDRGDRISWTGDAHLAQKVRCAVFGSNLQSRMPLVPTPACLKQTGV